MTGGAASRPAAEDVLAGHPDGVVVADAAGIVVVCNRGAARLLGKAPEGVVG